MVMISGTRWIEIINPNPIQIHMECRYQIHEIHEIHYTTVFEFPKRDVYARAAPSFCNSMNFMDCMDSWISLVNPNPSKIHGVLICKSKSMDNGFDGFQIQEIHNP